MTHFPLYIHIGTHKTGSTSIQRALYGHREELLGEGVLYIRRPPELSLLMHQRELSHELVDACRHALVGQLTDAAKPSPHRCAVISDEGFSGDPSTAYDNAGVIARSLYAISSGFDTKIVVYLRRQDAFLEALYTQDIQAGQTYSFREFCKRLSDREFDWWRLVRSYADVFGRDNVVVRVYDKLELGKSGGLLRDFAATIGITAPAFCSEQMSVNRGFSRDALEIARHTNATLTAEQRGRLRRLLQAACGKQPFADYTFWQASERDQILARYASSNASVAREFLGRKDGVLFPETGEEAQTLVEQELTLEGVLEVATQALLEAQERFETRITKQAKAVKRLEARVEGLRQQVKMHDKHIAWSEQSALGVSSIRRLTSLAESRFITALRRALRLGRRG